MTLSNKLTKYSKIPTCFHFTYLFDLGKGLEKYVEKSMRTLYSFDSLRKNDNRACNKNIASLGTCANDRMLDTDRHDDFWG